MPTSIVPLLIANSRGIPFSLIVPGKLHRAAKPNIALIVRADSRFRTADGLHYREQVVIDKNGGNSTTVKKRVELPVSAVTAAVATKRIDAGGST